LEFILNSSVDNRLFRYNNAADNSLFHDGCQAQSS
jgi:hypothetical protein